MKMIIKSSVFIVLLLITSCSPKSNWKIQFCEELNESVCEKNTDTFNSDIEVFVTLECVEPIKEHIIIGNIYRMQDGSYSDYLGSKNFVINANSYTIKHSIPFDQLGGSGPHLIEFTKEDGTLIISKELFIK